MLALFRVTFQQYYWTISQLHLNNEQYYGCLFINNPSLNINQKLVNYANKYWSILTDN